METFYFGKSPKLLLGVYHPPQGIKTHNVGIVLCYPIINEYIRSHRAFVRLAHLLSKAGFHVLRFDYYGCGDSEGDCEKGELSQWINDISIAAEELKSGCDVENVCLIGLRMGGTMSLIAASKRNDIDTIILWEPIVSGEEYLEELTTLHKIITEGYLSRMKQKPGDIKNCERMGFLITDLMLKEIKRLDLLSSRQKSINNILLITNNDNMKVFSDNLRVISDNVSIRNIPGPQIWLDRDNEMYAGIVPIQILQFIVSWISEVYS